MATLSVRGVTTQEISHAVITAAMKVHSSLGPGLLESAYAACLQYELLDAGFQSSAQVGLPVVYRGVRLDSDTEWIWSRTLWLLRLSPWMPSPLSIWPKSFRTLNSVVNP